MLKPGFEKQVSLEECRRVEEKETVRQMRIRAIVRFDYRGKARPSRFFFGGKSTEEAAEELRQQQAALWKNVPVQGIFVENIELGDIYTVYDDDAENEVAFAPMEIKVLADSLEQLVRFAVRDEFRRIRILEPENVSLNGHDMERLFFQVNEQFRTTLFLKAKKYQD